jgi:hypothetical protein
MANRKFTCCYAWNPRLNDREGGLYPCRTPAAIGARRGETAASGGALGAITTREAMRWIINHPLGRRDLEPFATIELAEQARPWLQARAKANQQVRKGDQAGATRQNLAELDTRQAIADMAGMSSVSPRARKPRHDFVYISAELSRLCRIGVSPWISMFGLSRAEGLMRP